MTSAPDVLEHGAAGEMVFWCAGCNCMHFFRYVAEEKLPCWSWNNSMTRPSVNPSILVRYGQGEKPAKICHFYIRDGLIDYLSDCNHSLAGKTVPMTAAPF